jgi:hypothetical protein
MRRPPKGQLSGDRSEDAPHAIRVHTGSVRNLGEGKSLPFQVKQRTMLGRTLCHDSFPQLRCLGNLAGARQKGLQRVVLFDPVEWLFARRSAFIPLNAIKQAVARYDKEKAAKVIGVDKAPASFPKAAEHV